jgi:hypothetical protein
MRTQDLASSQSAIITQITRVSDARTIAPRSATSRRASDLGGSRRISKLIDVCTAIVKNPTPGRLTTRARPSRCREKKTCTRSRTRTSPKRRGLLPPTSATPFSACPHLAYVRWTRPAVLSDVGIPEVTSRLDTLATTCRFCTPVCNAKRRNDYRPAPCGRLYIWRRIRVRPAARRSSDDQATTLRIQIWAGRSTLAHAGAAK